MIGGERDAKQIEDALEQVLGDQPRADQWKEYREALAARLRSAITARDACTGDVGSRERAILDARVAELREMVRVLAEEEAITRFVEDSVQASLSRPASSVSDDEFDLDDAGY
jgi:hypothetical protein